MTAIVGIDPGIQGALALFRDGRLADLEDMPVFDGRVDGSWVGHYLEDWDTRNGTYESGCVRAVYLEWTQPMPKNGSIASYSLGLNSGIVIGVVQAMGFPLERVRPQAWKKMMGLLKKPKAASRGMASELFPEFADQFRRVKDDGRAEAALIARYGAYVNIRTAVTERDENGEMASVSELRGARTRHPSANGGADVEASQGVESQVITEQTRSSEELFEERFRFAEEERHRGPR